MNKVNFINQAQNAKNFEKHYRELAKLRPQARVLKATAKYLNFLDANGNSLETWMEQNLRDADGMILSELLEVITQDELKAIDEKHCPTVNNSQVLTDIKKKSKEHPSKNSRK